MVVGLTMDRDLKDLGFILGFVTDLLPDPGWILKIMLATRLKRTIGA